MSSCAGRSVFPAFRAVLLLSLALPLLAGCGGDGAGGEAGIEVDDIDQETPLTATEEEVESFEVPVDSVLTEDQVTAYLRTVLLQFDLLVEEREKLRGTVQTMEQRQQDGGALNELRNVLDATGTLAGSMDVIGGSYVRSARSLGFNPAELEWVRERMAEIAGQLMMVPMQAQSQQAVAEMRAEAERMRAANTGANANPEMETYARQLLEMADEMEANGQPEVPQSVTRNLEVLRATRSAVTDEMWAAIGFAGGASGLITISGFDDPNNPEFQQQLDDLRRIYQDALENRASPVTSF